MPTSKIGQDALNSLTGNLPKAILFVRKYSPAMNLGTTAGEQKALTDSIKLQKALVATTKSKLGGNAGTASFETLKAKGMASGFTALRVQYNPSTIYMDTSAGLREVDESSISNIMNNQIKQFKSDAITTLGMQLIFDDMDLMDAFMLDTATLNTGNALSAAGKVTGIKRTKFSVRTEVEGLIACLFSPITRLVVFCWSDMVFRGELFQVNANYTMFNKYGDPIRALVEITIQQDHLMETAERGGYWDTAFTAAFGNAGTSAVSGAASAFSKATNNSLLNLSI
ncbi:MAG: hypothetical protein K6F53_12430 [Lachnospiraceae bacterium]|nr:hypothetical protein [Lachnospiraceae bacterium]